MNKKSFTLIELLVVIAIIGILSSLVIARFSDWNDKAKIANALQWSAGVHRNLGANLVGHWPLNGNANDISGYGSQGSIHGGASFVLNGVPGTGNQALEFDGVDDHVSLGNITTIAQNGPATISGWFKFSQLAGQKGTYINIHNQLFQHNANDYLYLGGGGANFFSIGRFLSPNTWYNIVLTYNGTHETSVLYVNGVKHNVTIQVPNTNHSSSQPFRVGNIFDGLISDIRIYSATLTAEEVGRIYAENRDEYLTYDR